MNRNRRISSSGQRGMSLAEVIVTTAIFTVIFIVALMVYDQSNKVFKTSVEQADMQQNTRAGFDRLVSDVRMAGYDADRDGVPARSPSGLWTPSTVYAPGAIVAPTIANGFSYRAVSGGESGNLEPAWNTTPGATLSGDGTVTWVTLGPVFQQPDEQIEFAGRSAITIRANFDFQTDIPNEHGREEDYEPLGGQFPIVTTANEEIVTYALRSDSGPNPDTLEFWADTTRPRTAYPGGSAERRVQIPNVDLCASGCNNPPYTLMRFTLNADGTPDAGTPIANNIRSLNFFYNTDFAATTLLLDDDGSTLTQGAIGGDGRYDPANIGGTTNWGDRAQRASILTVRVELVGMNARPDRDYVNPNETLASVRNYRTYTLTSNVSPRNLGLSGLSEPETRPPSPPVITSVCAGACRVTRVQWNPSTSGNVDSYEVRWDTSPTGTFANVGIVVPGDVVSAPVFDLPPGTLHYFRVIAVNEIGRSDITDSNTFSRSPINSTRPGPVSDTSATEGASAEPNQITLSWRVPSLNDPALANMSCQGTAVSGLNIDPAEQIRYRIWRGTTEDFNPAATPPEGEIVLDDSLPTQPTGPAGTVISWTDDANNALGKPPANCKDYYYRIQVYDSCSLASYMTTYPNGNDPVGASTGMSDIFPRAEPAGTDPAFHGYASSTIVPTAPEQPKIDYTNNNSTCDNATNLCDVKIVWPAVKTDVSNPTGIITIDQYRVRRERKKAAQTSWTPDTVLPVLVNASSDGANMEGDNVVYHDTTALDEDPNDRRKWYYRYTITALQCGAESDPSPPVEFPASCGLAGSAVIETGAASGDGSAASPWVMAATDYITVTPPTGVQLDRVLFETYPEPDPNPNNPPIDRFEATSPPFDYFWANQDDGQVYRVVITMTNDEGCTEQTERFIQDDPVNCPSSVITASGFSSGSGTSGQPWLMDAGDVVRVNPPAQVAITSVTFQLFKTPGNSSVLGPVTLTTTPFDFTWVNQLDNETYRLNILIAYEDGCTEDIDRFITDEPPPVCSGATASVSGATSGDGTSDVTPWVLNGGDIMQIVPPVNGNINQVIFTITPVSPAGSPLPATSDSTSPFTLTWSDQTDLTVYKVEAVITYAPGCTETVTRFVRDEICSGATVSQVGSAGAGTGLTTSSPWVFNGGDTVTVTRPAGAGILDVQFRLFDEPGTTVLASSSDAVSPFTFSWTDRTDLNLYRLEMTVTYAAGCSEVITRYIRDQGSCFITASTPSITTVESGSRKIATITYTITNPSTEVITLKGMKVDWLRDSGHPEAVLQQIVYNGSVTQSVTSQAPPTTNVMNPITPTPATVPASSSTYTIAVKFDIGHKNQVVDLGATLINGLCIQYTVPSFGGTTASCNVLGSTTGNPTSCN